ncbi:MAG: hypothetical protein OEU93_16105 [Rubrivivax sp.]|nr:hypothetical protein [Rubrivivax sp.]MDH5338802.1 hypothetical protein [Rubrivivax sp.]
MNRCVLPALALAGAALCLPAQAQRNFPPQALRGQLVIEQPPNAQLNGERARLAPGVRIRGENNLLQMSGALAGKPLVVNFMRDDFGLITAVWILTAAERDREPWPRTAEQAALWHFDPLAQTWTKP